LKIEKSLALEDILAELHKHVINTKFNDEVKMFLISRMADIEYRMA
jgi:hypothetical protein